MNTPAELTRQHLIDPELCIRCNTCEETCTKGAIVHNALNYVVQAGLCNACRECVANCPTSAVDNWHYVAIDKLYAIQEQFAWTSLPPQEAIPAGIGWPRDEQRLLAPESAAKAEVNLYTTHKPATARLRVNRRLTPAASASDIRNLVIDFGETRYPVLEGQSIGILPPGRDADGAPHRMRVYSVASARDGELRGTNSLALTVKRVTEDHEGQPTVGLCSNYLCDLEEGAEVEVVGPFGASFLMPDDPTTSIVMMCAGTGVAPMRGMIERRRRIAAVGAMLLFYGGRTPAELPYHEELQQLPPGLVDVNLAFSRLPGEPKTYIQDLIRRRAADIAALLVNDRCYF